jgi:carbon-monoxide dehydrogenase large subunit
MTDNYVGKRVKRTEDPRLIRGLAHYVDDIACPARCTSLCSFDLRAREDQQHRHSAAARARAWSLFTRARTLPTRSDQCRARCVAGLKVPDHRVLATNKVYFVGPSESPQSSPPRSLRASRCNRSDHWSTTRNCRWLLTSSSRPRGGPVIHEAFSDNIAYRLSSGEGDIDAAFAAADRTVKQRILHKRLAPIAMEPARRVGPLLPW